MESERLLFESRTCGRNGNLCVSSWEYLARCNSSLRRLAGHFAVAEFQHVVDLWCRGLAADALGDSDVEAGEPTIRF
jgi:hypothetical protein